MSSYCLDVVLFISEVKKYPEIWDLNSEDNRFKTKKLKAWSEITRLLIPDFDDMSEHEKGDLCKYSQEIIHTAIKELVKKLLIVGRCFAVRNKLILDWKARRVRKLQGKWRNIRDSYVRHVRRRTGKKSYLYAEHLTFLDNLYKQKSQSGSEEECDNDEVSEEDEKLKNISFNRKFEVFDNPVWGSDADDSNKGNLKRKRSAEEDIALEFVDTPFSGNSSFQTNCEDEDRSFFESLLPAVRQFSMDQKLEFRSEILGLIKNIRSANDPRPYIKIDTNTFD